MKDEVSMKDKDLIKNHVRKTVSAIARPHSTTTKIVLVTSSCDTWVLPWRSPSQGVLGLCCPETR